MSYKEHELLTLRGAHSTPSFSNLLPFTDMLRRGTSDETLLPVTWEWVILCTSQWKWRLQIMKLLLWMFSFCVYFCLSSIRLDLIIWIRNMNCLPYEYTWVHARFFSHLSFTALSLICRLVWEIWGNPLRDFVSDLMSWIYNDMINRCFVRSDWSRKRKTFIVTFQLQ
jgi:hypothetical protein